MGDDRDESVVSSQQNVEFSMRRTLFDWEAQLKIEPLPVALAAALATIRAYEEDGLIERAGTMGKVTTRHHEEPACRQPSVGAHRSVGLVGCLELVRDRTTGEPMAPFNSKCPEMAALASFARGNGASPRLHSNRVMTDPPLRITEAEMNEGSEVLDRTLEFTDRAVTG